MKKNIKRIIIVLLLALGVYTGLNVSAATGYMYSSDGKLIECSAGYTVTEDGIYNILSDSWKGFLTDTDSEGNKINSTTSFNSPSDLCLYTDKETGKDTIYVVDSSSNSLFIFDGSLNYKKTVKRFLINPANFTENQLIKIKTKSDSAAVSTTFWTMETATKYADNPTGTKLYIDCLGLSGVYRALRPKRDANNKILLDVNGETIYEDNIYLCDTTNHQVLLLDANTYEVVQVVSAPEGVDFTNDFQPTKIVTDVTGRMYIISINIYEGILLMNYNGSFMRMVGVNYTQLSFWDAFKRSQKTEEQLAQEQSILQTSFNNLAIDAKGFLYTVSKAIENADGTYTTDTMIKKINQSNSDVLKRNGYSKPIGDLITIKTGTNRGESNFVAIAINSYGVYTVVDTKGNRMFTYDNEGNLLYISGGSGSQVTDILSPVAIAYQGENLILLDKGHKCIKRFEPTDFAKSINKAVKFEFYGDFDSATDEWQNVIEANPAYELAYVGVGKRLYDEKRYTEAMLNFEKGADVKYFSRAYKMYRDDIIAEYFPYVGAGLLILIGASIVWKVVKKVKHKNPGYEDGEL